MNSKSVNKISENKTKKIDYKEWFSHTINKVLILCINFVICANLLIFFRNDLHPFEELFHETKHYFTFPPFNLTSRPLQNLLHRLFGLLFYRAADSLCAMTIVFSPFLIFMFYKYLELYEFEESTRSILLFIFSTLAPFQNYFLGFNWDFLFLTLFLAAIYYLKIENRNLFILFSVLAILSKEVGILLVILNFFVNLDTSDKLFNRTNIINALIAVPFFVFLLITRFLLNPVTVISVFGFESQTLLKPFRGLTSAICFFGLIWIIPIFVWNKLSKTDKIYIGILFGIYLPLIIFLGNIWELKLLIPYAFGFLPPLGFWLEGES